MALAPLVKALGICGKLGAGVLAPRLGQLANSMYAKRFSHAGESQRFANPTLDNPKCRFLHQRAYSGSSVVSMVSLRVLCAPSTLVYVLHRPWFTLLTRLAAQHASVQTVERAGG